MSATDIGSPGALAKMPSMKQTTVVVMIGTSIVYVVSGRFRGRCKALAAISVSGFMKKAR